MNDVILKILPAIEEVVNVLVSDKETRHDLQQDLILKCYENEGRVRRLVFVETGSVKNWLFITARNMNTDRLKANKFDPIKEFEQVYDEIEETQHRKDFIKPAPEMLAQLPEIERMWIEFWVECEFNYLEMQRRSGEKGIKNRISRQHAKKRITGILEKWKQLDIYLPQSELSGCGLTL